MSAVFDDSVNEADYRSAPSASAAFVLPVESLLTLTTAVGYTNLQVAGAVLRVQGTAALLTRCTVEIILYDTLLFTSEFVNDGILTVGVNPTDGSLVVSTSSTPYTVRTKPVFTSNGAVLLGNASSPVAASPLPLPVSNLPMTSLRVTGSSVWGPHGSVEVFAQVCFVIVCGEGTEIAREYVCVSG